MQAFRVFFLFVFSLSAALEHSDSGNWLVGMSGNVVEQETIVREASLSGNEVSLPAGKQPNLLFAKCQ